MRAAVQTRYGTPEVVRICEVDKPTPRDNEVLVNVHATTVNRTDCATRAAKPFFMRLATGLIRPRATVLGTEFAGVVEAVGSGVTSFELGQRVFGYNEGPSVLMRSTCQFPRTVRSRPSGECDVSGGRCQHRGFALCPRAHQGGKGP